jgi:hypothetical protein
LPRAPGHDVHYKRIMRVLAVLVVLEGVAVADEVAPPPDANKPPGWLLIERLDGNSAAGGDVTYMLLDGDGDTPVMRVDLHGRYVHPRRRLGGYIDVPVAVETGSGNDTAGIGDIELGGLFLPRFTSPEFGMTVHVGLTLPTGNTDKSGVLNLLAAYARPEDLILSLPHGTSLRIGASPTFRSGNVFAKVAVGVDVNIDQTGDQDADSVFRLGFGFGVDIGSFAVTAEISNLFPTNDAADTLAVGALGIRVPLGMYHPYAAVIIPLEDDTQAVYEVAVTAGLEVALP